MSKKTIINGLLLFFLVINFNTMQAQETITFKTLNTHQQTLSAISALTATGNLEELKTLLNDGLDAGLTINEIKEALVQLYAYCGFPRSLNAVGVFKTVVEERAAKGIKDTIGKDIVVENNPTDKYEQGRKVLEELTKTAQAKPAPGFGEFALRADAFLKEHLFADIFASDVLNFRQREFVTISALAAMPGVEPQLKAHIGMGKNTGVTDEQLKELCLIIEKYVSREQANVLRNVIGEAQVPVINPDMMVRIAELEIKPEFLNEYKTILKEQASISLKKEPGVIALFPISQTETPLQIRLVEIYADKAAYDAHIASSHFQLYKTTTLKMVLSLKLVEMNALDTETMTAIFEKLK